jgi:2'-5' RNA ligase
MNADKRRLFVALDFPEDVREVVERAISGLRRLAADWKWIKLANVHLTLKFIGETEKLVEIVAALDAIPFPGPLTLEARGLGFFPDDRRPRVFWVGLAAPQALAELARAVEQALVPLGIPAEDRVFSPHLTLARLREPRVAPDVTAAIHQQSEVSFGAFKVSSFALYQSRLSPGGSEYTKLREFPAKER